MLCHCFTIIQTVLCLYQFPLTKKKLASMPTVFQNSYLKRNLYLHSENCSCVDCCVNIDPVSLDI